MIQWLTTAAINPGPWQSGWKCHAVIANDTDTFSEVGRRIALCGLKPRYGWCVDLFIDAHCKRCEQAISKWVAV